MCTRAELLLLPGSLRCLSYRGVSGGSGVFQVQLFLLYHRLSHFAGSPAGTLYLWFSVSLRLAYDAETGDYVARVNAFRFLNDNDIRLKLSNSGGEICYKTVELADFMNEHAISVEDKDEAEIAIRFRFNNTSVEVAPWEEEDIDPIQK